MPSLAQNTAFLAYALAACVLSLNLFFLWSYSGVLRSRSKTTPNPEDTTTVARGAELTSQDSPEVARVLRAHTNTSVNTLPFLVLGLVYVLLDADPVVASVLFAGFTLMRLGYTYAYLRGWQPFRTIFYVLGGLFTLAVLLQVLRAVLPGLLVH